MLRIILILFSVHISSAEINDETKLVVEAQYKELHLKTLDALSDKERAHTCPTKILDACGPRYSGGQRPQSWVHLKTLINQNIDFWGLLTAEEQYDTHYSSLGEVNLTYVAGPEDQIGSLTGELLLKNCGKCGTNVLEIYKVGDRGFLLIIVQ